MAKKKSAFSKVPQKQRVSQRPFLECMSQASMALQSGHFAMAEALLNEAVVLQAHDAEAWMLLGIACLQQGAAERGVVALAQSLKLNPQQPETRYNHAYGLAEAGRLDEAASSYQEAVKLAPRDPEVWMAFGKVLVDLQRYAEAQAAFEKVVSLMPLNADAWNNLGNALYEQHCEGEALSVFDKALVQRAVFPEACFNRGKALSALGRYDEALASYDLARVQRPDYPEACWHQSWIQLLQGNFPEGWSLYESRWSVPDFRDQRRSFAAPLWLGQASLERCHILLWAEQGLGDTLQFIRYIPLLLAQGARVTLEVQPLLLNLLKHQWPDVAVVPKGADLPGCDWHCPLMSLPLALQTTLATVPAEIPYLRADSGWKAPTVEWSAPRKPRVGLVWSGNPGHKNDLYRSMPLETLAPIFACDADFVSLQPALRTEDANWLATHSEIKLHQVALTDFTQTAALIEQLDWVITVDTSVAHLAGALGKPVWILLPVGVDYRWMLDRNDTPWYPTARLFRQTERNDWASVIKGVVQSIQARMATELN